MLIPILHFEGTCADAIALYEKAFNTKASGYDYGDDGSTCHCEIIIHGHKLFLNDAKAFLRDSFGVDYNAHLILTFSTPDELLACYESLKKDELCPLPFLETSYSKLVGNFVDKFGVLWGFMVVE